MYNMLFGLITKNILENNHNKVYAPWILSTQQLYCACNIWTEYTTFVTQLYCAHICTEYTSAVLCAQHLYWVHLSCIVDCTLMYTTSVLYTKHLYWVHKIFVLGTQHLYWVHNICTDYRKPLYSNTTSLQCNQHLYCTCIRLIKIFNYCFAWY